MDMLLLSDPLLTLSLIGLLLAAYLIRKLQNAIFVWFITTTDVTYAFRWKMQLFRSMETGKCIVEVGAGTGSNLRFYPAGSKVICVEPFKEFQQHLENNIERWASHLARVEVLQCDGEDLVNHIPETSVDYVVCTFVLCSVAEVRKVLINIYRILKPGGMMLYLEHTMSNYTPMRIYQKLLTPITSYLLDGCHYDRKPEMEIEQLRLFKETQFTEELITCMSWLHPERTQVWGRAVK